MIVTIKVVHYRYVWFLGCKELLWQFLATAECSINYRLVCEDALIAKNYIALLTYIAIAMNFMLCCDTATIVNRQEAATGGFIATTSEKNHPLQIVRYSRYEDMNISPCDSPELLRSSGPY